MANDCPPRKHEVNTEKFESDLNNRKSYSD